MVKKGLIDTKTMAKKLASFLFSKYDEAIYEKIDLDKLMAFTLSTLISIGLSGTEENLYVQAFLLFPKRFSLPSFDFYPNAARMDKSVRRCRSDKHYFTGNAEQNYVLTELGQQKAQEVKELLEEGILGTGKTRETGVKGAREILSRFQTSDAFKTYLENGMIPLEEWDFIALIGVPATASADLFIARGIYLDEIFSTEEDEQIRQFWHQIRKKFSYFFQK
jgi:hypothetical protein